MTQSAPTKALIGWMQQETVQVAHHGWKSLRLREGR